MANGKTQMANGWLFFSVKTRWLNNREKNLNFAICSLLFEFLYR